MPAELHRPNWGDAYPSTRYLVTVSGIPKNAETSFLTLNKTNNPDGAHIAACYLNGEPLNGSPPTVGCLAGLMVTIPFPLPAAAGFAYGYGLHDFRYQSSSGARLAISPHFTVREPLEAVGGTAITTLGTAVTALQTSLDTLADQFTVLGAAFDGISAGSSAAAIGAALAIAFPEVGKMFEIQQDLVAEVNKTEDLAFNNITGFLVGPGANAPNAAPTGSPDFSIDIGLDGVG